MFHLQADIKNWNHITVYVDDNSEVESGGFYAFGVDGVFRGVVIILHMFMAFDAMIMSRWAKCVWHSKQYCGNVQQPTNIEHFSEDIGQAIQSINIVTFVCLLGMAFALTTIQPVHSMVSFDTF